MAKRRESTGSLGPGVAVAFLLPTDTEFLLPDHVVAQASNPST